MDSELEGVVAQAELLVGVAEGRPEAVTARELTVRLTGGRFLISAVGGFKAGKSSVLNALVGDPVLPTGVVPLTAVATELSFGEPGAQVELVDGSTSEIARDRVVDFVTEEANPGNVRRVAGVRVRGRWPLLAPGVVLVDTPGFGSAHEHNTDAAGVALLEADGAVLVMSADAPASDQDRALLRSLADRLRPTFFVVNKVDHLAAGDVETVRRFVAKVIEDTLGHAEPVLMVSARSALEAVDPGRGPRANGDDFVGLVQRLEQFIAEGLVRAKLGAARRELLRLVGSVDESILLQAAALDLQVSTLAGQLGRFSDEAGRQRRGFADDSLLLERDVAKLASDVGARLDQFARHASAGWEERFSRVAEGAPRGHALEVLRREVETVVQASFEDFRNTEGVRCDQAWQRIAEQFRARTIRRVTEVRQVASDLFAIPLPGVDVPAVAEERERFSYLFLHLAEYGETYLRAGRLLVPRRLERSRALQQAHRELGQELDKHAGRARADIVERLTSTMRRFQSVMRAQLETTIEAIAAATERADVLHTASEQERQQWRTKAEHKRAVLARLRSDPA